MDRQPFDWWRLRSRIYGVGAFAISLGGFFLMIVGPGIGNRIGGVAVGLVAGVGSYFLLRH